MSSRPNSGFRFHQRRLNSDDPISNIRAQIQNFSNAQITSSTAVDDLPRVRIGDTPYFLEAHLHNRRPRTSWVWLHGIPIVQCSSMETFWSCNHCDAVNSVQLYSAATTSTARRHLKRKHLIKKIKGVDDDGEAEEDEDEDNTQGKVDEMFGRPAKRQKSTSSRITESLYDRFRAALLAWIVNYQIAFIAIQNSFFRDLVDALCPSLVEYVPCGNTIRTWIMQEYIMQKAKMKTRLKEDPLGKIHISFDLWTSPNSMALMAVVAHYCSRDYRSQTKLLGLRRLHGEHSGENQADLLIEIIKEYEITDRLGWFVTDNASNNNTAMDQVLRTLLPDLTPEQRGERRLRCWGHILNLAAKAFLYGKNPENFDEEVLINRTLAREQEELQAWRRRGPIGKLHNVVVFIRRSPQRLDIFRELADAGDDFAELKMVQDNATRWNSAYDMIDRALKKRANVERFIESSIYEVNKNKIVPVEDRLTKGDWLTLEETHSILEPFYSQTQRLQSKREDGTHGSAWEAYISCEFLLKHILDKRQQYSVVQGEAESESRRHIRTSIENCWAKLDDYYKLLDDLPVYMGALVLHPGYKLAFIEKIWAGKRIWLENARKSVKRLWETGWKGRHSAFEPNTPPDESTNALIDATLSHEKEADPFEIFMNPPNLYTTQSVTIDEYKKYLEIPAKKTNEPLAWWRERYTQWPSLTTMACDLISIPLMSAECERVFSAAGYLITSRRNHMKEDIIEATTCLRAWQRCT